MERLTFDGNFCDIAQCRELPCKYGGTCTQKQVWDRLKQFEDAVQTPENFYKMYGELCLLESALKNYGSHNRMKELAKADKDGRVLVLPCKVGDTVYRTFTIDGEKPVILETQIKTVWQAADVLRFAGKRNNILNIFLTREEAEKALLEMEGKKDG